MQCRSHAGQLGRLYKEFQSNNCEILLILGENEAAARNYTEILHLPFQVLADPERRVFHQYGLQKVLLQRTASLVIDRDGIIRYLRLTFNPMVWLKETRELLEFVKKMANEESR